MKRSLKNPKDVFVPEFLIQMILLHGVLIAGLPFFMSLKAAIVGLGLGYIFGHSMGIFHHMYLTHASFQCHKWVERIGVLFGTLSWRGAFTPPLKYVAVHRVHHDTSDTMLDPHTPEKGYFFAFMGWFWKQPEDLVERSSYTQYTKDLNSKPFVQFLDKHYQLLQLTWALLCFAAGALHSRFDPEAGSFWFNGLRFVYVGVFVKSFFVIYMGNTVDLLNHTLGYQSYKSKDHSTNSLLMGMLHGGGAIAWHNNHHAHQTYFAVRKKWWEIDLHYQSLRLLQKLGLVWDIKVFDEYKMAKKNKPKTKTKSKPIVRPQLPV